MATARNESRKGSAPGRTTMLEPIGFWSYARADDEAAGNALTDLRLVLKRELMQQLGRDVALFQDVAAIPKGAEWAREIRHAIDQSTFFIPIVTPRFIQSRECAREMQMFLDRQQAIFDAYPDLPRESRIFPILYIKIDDIEPIDRHALAEINKRQYFDFTKLRLEESDSKAVRVALADFAQDLCRVLRARVAVPMSEEEREAQRREVEAAAKAEREAAEARAQADREAEAARARAAAEAEEARKRAEEAAKQAATDAARRAALAAEVKAHDDKRTALAALSMRLDNGLTHSKKEHERREARAARVKQVRAGLGRIIRVGAWIAGAIAALFVLMVVYFMIFPKVPPKPDDAPPRVTDNLTGNQTAAGPAAPPAPAKPRFAAESWITAQRWAVSAKCSSPVSFSIEGNDLIVNQGGAPERHAIDAARSTEDRLVADGLTLSRKSPRPAAGSRMTMSYPDLKVELLPCAARR